MVLEIIGLQDQSVIVMTILSIIFWSWFLLRYFPMKMKQLKQDLKNELPEIIKEAAPMLKKELNIDPVGMIVDIAEKISKADEKELEKVAPAIGLIASHIIGAGMAMAEKDDHFKAWLRGFINKQTESIFKGLTTRADTMMAEYGLAPQEGGMGTEADPGMSKMMNMFKAFQQVKKAFGGQ